MFKIMPRSVSTLIYIKVAILMIIIEGILVEMAQKTIGQDDVQIGWTQVHFFQCMTIET